MSTHHDRIDPHVLHRCHLLACALQAVESQLAKQAMALAQLHANQVSRAACSLRLDWWSAELRGRMRSPSEDSYWRAHACATAWLRVD